MKRWIKKIGEFFTPNRIALVLGCLLLIISLFLVIRMQKMREQLNELTEREAILIEELQEYSN